jgi:ornithine--oxo-acid transaminase
MGVLQPGEHGSTFGGNPLACAIARTALKVLVEENMIENAAEIGTYFLTALKQINNPMIKEVRGIGLMIGLELRPEAGGARQYCEKLAGIATRGRRRTAVLRKTQRERAALQGNPRSHHSFRAATRHKKRCG